MDWLVGFLRCPLPERWILVDTSILLVLVCVVLLLFLGPRFPGEQWSGVAWEDSVVPRALHYLVGLA
jgi:hypothetical protein